MTFVLPDRVKETTTTTGTGTLSLLGALTGHYKFSDSSGVGNGNSCAYLIDDGNGNWEETFGTVTAGTSDTLSRGTLIKSSTGSRINFAAGTKTVAIVPLAELLLQVAGSGALVETDIASATTTDLGSVFTFRARITGITTITGFGTQPNCLRWVRFAGILTLTHNATSLILLGGANRTTAAGDLGLYISDASGNWREISYHYAASLASFFDASASDPSGTTSTAAIKMMGLGSTWSVTPKRTGNLRVTVWGDAGNNTANDGCVVQIRYGTGTAPTNGAAQTGTQAGRNKSFESAFNSQFIDFSIPGDITGLTIGTPYWFDIGLAAETGGLASVVKNSIRIEEY